ncbi:MAG: Iron complex outerrane recepter protein [Verrucomicrobia bacterium]|nr:Iron complex outerrane recepter protein [Verrucomicrobiota bacterium]
MISFFPFPCHPRPPFWPTVATARWIPIVLVGLLAAAAHGASPSPGADKENLGDLSLEQLMNESVTSVSKKEQRLFDTAAAVSVLTNDDLRRSGATSFAESLRLVPGMDVGLINASQWAISVRGFQGPYANKLLVLIDGRAVYDPSFAGVYWDIQQAMLEDVDRIEVIRGPGATVWGANAVNGVINLVSKSARDTQGGLVSGSAGSIHPIDAGVRYGGRAGDHTYFRIFSSYQSTDDFPTAAGGQGGDRWSVWQVGTRIDSYPSESVHWTAQGGLTEADLDHDKSEAYNANALLRWTQTSGAGSSTEAQAYYNRSFRDEPTRAHSETDIFDLTLQHISAPGAARQEFIWGVGARFETTRLEQTTPFIAILDGKLSTSLFSAFLQDEIKLVPDRLLLTLGSKVEHNDFTGFELQPSVRLAFKATPKQTLWAAVSRAVRTPDDAEHEQLLAITLTPIVIGGGLYFPTLTGSSQTRAEVLQAYEIGYRAQASQRVSVDVALFYNEYRDLIAGEFTGNLTPGTGPFPGTGRAEQVFANSMSGTGYGGEVSLTFAPTEELRFTAIYSSLLMRIHGGVATTVDTLERGSPRNQAGLRVNYDFTRRAALDGAIRYVGAVLGVPSYTTADIRLSYRPSLQLEFALVGQNLLDPQHAEQPAALGPTLSLTEVPRSVYAKATWKF